jgi:hypothetical protein
MTKPDILIVDGGTFSWQRLCKLCRQRLEARKAAQGSGRGRVDDALENPRGTATIMSRHSVLRRWTL